MSIMEFKSLRRRDFGKIQQFAITGMHLFNYTSNRIELFFYAKYFWYLELLRATRIYAAYDGDEFAGVLLLDIAGEGKAYKSKWASIFVKVMEWVMQWGYADMSDQYSNANTTMLAKYKKDHAVDGELNFFLVNGEIVGKGVGSKLLFEAEKDLQGKHIYLYTDDGSTFQFYDKRGFTRVGEKQISMLNGTDSVPLTAMLYAKEY
ncbi:GNAT family N-acetyltransferase [Weissella cibaria]|nr:GNAT family N-acetyltransferase [Weissella cibaria]MCT8400311.1 GNAT family N-acetyltransferase [Weissella cibaria]